MTASVKHRLLFDGRTFATFLAYWSDASAEPLQAALTLPVEGVPAVYQLSSGTRLQAAGYSRDQQTGQVRVSVPRPGGAVLVDFSEGAAEVFVERSGVSAERPLYGGRDHRAPPAAAARPGRAGAQLHRLGADGRSTSARR